MYDNVHGCGFFFPVCLAEEEEEERERLWKRDNRYGKDEQTGRT